MSDTVIRKNPVLSKLREAEMTRFHGQITIHYAHGKPKKIETKQVEDINE